MKRCLTTGLAFAFVIASPVLAVNIGQSNIDYQNTADSVTIVNGNIQVRSIPMLKAYPGPTKLSLSEDNVFFSHHYGYVKDSIHFQAFDLNNLASSYSETEDLGLGNNHVTYFLTSSESVTFYANMLTVSYPGPTKLETLNTGIARESFYVPIRASPA